MRVLTAGILGGIAMYVWATIAHLSPLATIGVHTMPNEPLVTAALKLNLGDKGGVYVYPVMSATPKADAPKTVAAGMLAYKPNAPAGLSPTQLGVEFALEIGESLLLAFALALASSFGARLGLAVLVGLIAGVSTNLSYWNWWGFGLDYTLANGFIELVKYTVAGLVIAAMLGRKRAALNPTTPPRTPTLGHHRA